MLPTQQPLPYAVTGTFPGCLAEPHPRDSAPSPWNRHMKTKAAVIVLLVACSGVMLRAEAKPRSIRHAGFNDFNQGTLGDSGANLYVSKGGRVQVINTWDFNGDGYNDVLLSNDHDVFEIVDAFVYWGSSNGFASY